MAKPVRKKPVKRTSRAVQRVKGAGKGTRGVSDKSAISSSGRPVTAAERRQIEMFGDPQGRKASPPQEISTNVEAVIYNPKTGEPRTDRTGAVRTETISKRYHMQEEDRGSDLPLRNTFGPDFQPIVAPKAEPSRSGHFAVGHAAARGHAVAAAMGQNQRYWQRIAGELMLPGESGSPIESRPRKAARMVSPTTPAEEQIRSAPQAPGWGMETEVVPNPRNKRNNTPPPDMLRKK